ncbi:MAG: hypothetical protein IKD77_05315 [Bacilli bacterium]|nr:hypothetical protein [Bacilli bacterium]
MFNITNENGKGENNSSNNVSHTGATEYSYKLKIIKLYLFERFWCCKQVLEQID